MKKYFSDIFQSVWTVLLGMKITGQHLFTRACTMQYPDQRWVLPERSRMRLFNKIEDCIGCGQCVRACPVDCIYMTTEKRTKEEAPVFARMARRSNCASRSSTSICPCVVTVTFAPIPVRRIVL